MPNQTEAEKAEKAAAKEAEKAAAKEAEEAEKAAAEKAEKEAKAADEAKAAAKKKTKAEKKPPYSLAMGKSMTTKKGILADGAEIKAADLAGGKAALDAFVKSGHLVKA